MAMFIFTKNCKYRGCDFRVGDVVELSDRHALLGQRCGFGVTRQPEADIRVKLTVDFVHGGRFYGTGSPIRVPIDTAADLIRARWAHVA